jgi:ubiquinone/menaquinone biosynthesis C-methylase UbiE
MSSWGGWHDRGVARYDGIADWYDEQNAAFMAPLTHMITSFLGHGPGRCLEVGCGGGLHLPALVKQDWTVTGVDLSADQLRVARQRMGESVELLQADAASLPFADATFDAVVGAFTHTDLDDWPAAVREKARVLRPGGRLVYAGVHPCFCGPFIRYRIDEQIPNFIGSYRDTAWRNASPAFGLGIRNVVGASHVPLADFLNSFLEAGFILERFDEPGPEDYPRTLVLAARR